MGNSAKGRPKAKGETDIEERTTIKLAHTVSVRYHERDFKPEVYSGEPHTHTKKNLKLCPTPDYMNTKPMLKV